MGHNRASGAAILLKLYVTGSTDSAKRAEKAVADLVHRYPDANIELNVVDVLSRPEIALADDVFATPTVIRTGGGLERRLVGDLSSVEKLEVGLLIDLMT
jgi:circadian clock protein KaiB